MIKTIEISTQKQDLYFLMKYTNKENANLLLKIAKTKAEIVYNEHILNYIKLKRVEK